MTSQGQELLRFEFNRWAKEGWAEAMERHHFRITEKAIRRMELGEDERILELGCGDGWACRLLAKLLGPRSRIVGLDISDEMIRLARHKSEGIENVRYLWGAASRIDCADSYFSRVLSVESFYYYPDQAAVLDELLRVTMRMGRIFLLMCIFAENPDSKRWVERLQVPVHVRSAAEYRALLESRGWVEVETEQFYPDPDSPPETQAHDRALLVSARKPESPVHLSPSS